MKLFMTRVSGFRPEDDPFISFGSEASKDWLLKESAPGDCIALVGTLRKPTPRQERGRLLGIAEIGFVSATKAEASANNIPGFCNRHLTGSFCKPNAIPIVRAWRFTPSPRLLDVLAEDLPYHATSQAVALSQTDAELILRLKTSIAVSQEFGKETVLQPIHRLGAVGEPTTGLKPITWTKETSRIVDRDASTYTFRFGGSNIWKIGHTVDVNNRLKQVNRHVPRELIGEEWATILEKRWRSEIDAYEMEQRVLGSLCRYRTEGERVNCTEEALLSAWHRAI